MRTTTLNRRRILSRPKNPSQAISPSPWLGLLTAGLVFTATITAASWYFGWTNTFQLIVIGSVAVVCLSAAWLWSSLTGDRRESLAPDSILVSLRRGGLLGATTLGLSALLMVGADYFPTYDRYLDRDRPQLDQQIALLVSADDHQRATELVSERLSKPMSDIWRQALHVQQVELLTQAAGTSTSTQRQQQASLEAAIALAQRFGVVAKEADLRLQTLLAEQEHSSEIVRLTRELEEQGQHANLALKQLPATWLQRVAATNNHNAIDAFLTLLLEGQPEENSQLHRRKLENLIDWGDRLEDLDQRAEKYSEAFALAQEDSLDGRLAESRLTEVRWLQQQRPVILPAGTRVYTTKQAMANDGHDRLHFRLEDADLQFVGGLKKKDFELLQGEQNVDDFEVVTLYPYSHGPTSVALLLDESPSTYPVQGDLRRAVAALVKNAAAHLQFRAMVFASEVHGQSEWTRSEADILEVLQGGAGGEGTALRIAVLTAIEELRTRPSPRVLVVFTDGADNTGQLPTEQALIDACQAADVQVFCIGLESTDLDETFLRRLAETTKGTYLQTRHAQELSGLFGHLQRELSQPFYQLRVFPSDATQEPLTLRIGRGDSALELPLHQGPEGEI